MHMFQSTSPETEPPAKQQAETQRDLAAVAGIVQVARAVGVKSEDQFDDVAHEVMNFIYSSQSEYEPGEEVVRCARDQLARTTGLVACKETVQQDSSSEARHYRYGRVPC